MDSFERNFYSERKNLKKIPEQKSTPNSHKVNWQEKSNFSRPFILTASKLLTTFLTVFPFFSSTMWACNGTSAFGEYISWTVFHTGQLPREKDYPYLNDHPNLVCPKKSKLYNSGAKVSAAYIDNNCNEDHLQQLVYHFGAVEVGIHAKDQSFHKYASNEIFRSCTPNKILKHSVTVVGYGVEDGVKYWKVKNSWGVEWGKNGFGRILRGKNECGIGKHCIVARCTKTV